MHPVFSLKSAMVSINVHMCRVCVRCVLYTGYVRYTHTQSVSGHAVSHLLVKLAEFAGYPSKPQSLMLKAN